MSGVERVQRDYRGAYLGEVLPQHPRGIRAGDVRHACPVCPLGRPRPDCPVCLAEGTVTVDQLDRYQSVINAEQGHLMGGR